MSVHLSQPDSVSYQERRWVLFFALMVLLVTTLPYILAYSRQTPNWQFTGFVFGVDDGNSYIAKMLGGAEGAWLFHSPYSTEPQRGVIAFLPYLLLGKLASPPGMHEQLVALYHLFRIIAGVLAILATYDFIAYFCRTVRLRRIGLVLASLGGGLGWMLIVLGKSQWLGSLPLEFYSPETFGFLALFGIPHLALARAGLLWGIVSYLRATSGQPIKLYLASLKLGGLWLVTAIAQPITAVVLGIVIALHLASTACWQYWKSKQNAALGWQKWIVGLRVAITGGLVMLPFMVYNMVLFNIDPYLKNWTVQNTIRSPHLLHYLLAYAVLLPFAYIGARSLLRRSPWQAMLPVAWLVAMPLLAYAPFNLQRRLPDGIWVALVTLAIAAMDHGTESVPMSGDGDAAPLQAYRWRFVFLLLFPSTLFLYLGGVLAALRPSQPVFRPLEEVRAFQYLASNAFTGEVVLTAFKSGNALPAWAPVRVVIGHGPESVGLARLELEVAAFFGSGEKDQIRLEFLRDHGVRYVFWGPEERNLGSWDPNQAAFLNPVYQHAGYSIFEVSDPD